MEKFQAVAGSYIHVYFIFSYDDVLMTRELLLIAGMLSRHSSNPNDCLEMYPVFSKILLGLLEDGGSRELRAKALETIVYISASPDKKISLFGHERVMEIVMGAVTAQANRQG
jgi:hypothetical protein